jgi:hypothetical protein
LIVCFADGAAAGGLGRESGFGEVEFVIGVAEEDEAEDRGWWVGLGCMGFPWVSSIN